ncbi:MULTISPECIES: hypothetical protein [unclassified Microcoleus]|uniref:hypothetical protein n=1 Tax=unclassified Microcoleus TaxID=2642155 RepID=UPI002FCFC8C0
MPKFKSRLSKPEDLKLTEKEPTLLFAIRDLIATGGRNWKKWWDNWRRGITNRAIQKPTNYPAADWKTPKFIELLSAEEQHKLGCRIIEYFPDKDDETVSYLLTGTDRDLIYHITAIGYQKGSNSDSISGKNSKPSLKGFPAIELFFISKPKVGKEAQRLVVGTKIIRCVGFTDDEKIANLKLARLVESADIKKWAAKIKSIFGNTDYCWSKGVNCLSYSGQVARLQGLEGYAYVRNESDGIALFAAMLKIFDAKPDAGGFNYSGKFDKTQFNNKTGSATVLKKTVKLDSKRPVADCYFYSAQLRLPLLKKPIPLVRKNVIVYET